MGPENSGRAKQGVFMHARNTCYEGLSENEAADCPIRRALENDFVVVTGTGNAREFIRLLTVELHGKHKEKTDLPDLPIKDPMRLSDCGALP